MDHLRLFFGHSTTMGCPVVNDLPALIDIPDELEAGEMEDPAVLVGLDDQALAGLHGSHDGPDEGVCAHAFLLSLR